MKTPKDYYSKHMVGYEKPNHIGFLSIKVLEFLNGREWDEVALAYVHSLRPSCIRVTTDCITLDARTWRVTVYVDNKNIITGIEQEVEVGLPDGVAHGEALRHAFHYEINSPQVKWHSLPNISGYFMDGINGGYYAITEDGEHIPFPEDDKK